ncbi:glyoxalase [Pseudooceanicola sp. GBMRC 2024]|uniref:Glyoxalase n=1 Tax=Pseudooceanicola albus TaxID=2692189 RepID=A0A6L7G5H2_9RHOB|nr:VOC family protein [Pseudooceanicola albus]MXN17903.1 glyoxalase [Pseudooceanicola albus]
MKNDTQPRFPVCALRSVELSVPDVAAAVAFYTETWGLAESARDTARVYLRGTGMDPYLVALSEGAPAILSVTYRADPGTDLATLRKRMLAAGAGIGADADGEIAALDLEGGGTGFALRDPFGRCIRVVQNDLLRVPVPGAAAHARPTRLAHVNINTPDQDRELAFFVEGMGFQLTDVTPIMGFLRCNPDHHAVVLARAEVTTLNHIAFLHDSWEEVMMAAGRMVDSGRRIEWGPGRHGPGDNVFTYFLDDNGFVIEHTAEILEVDDGYRVGGPADWTWPEGRSDQWGITVLKSDTCKQAQLAIPFT